MKNLQIYSKLNKLLNKFYKNMTLLIFFILPLKITNIFISLSILATVYDIKNINFSVDEINTDKLSNLLKISVSEEIMLLPNYTINWFWNDAFLNTITVINNQPYTVREIIEDSRLFIKHIRLVTELFLNNLPKSMKFKLGLNDPHNKIQIKHSIMSVLLRN